MLTRLRDGQLLVHEDEFGGDGHEQKGSDDRTSTSV